MSLLVMIGRKMIKNKWLELSLLLGMILSVALVGSMPIYTNAILQRMLVKDLERLQADTNDFSGSVTVGYSFSQEELDFRIARVKRVDRIVANAVNDSFRIPVHHYSRERRSMMMSVVPVDSERFDATEKRQADIGTLEHMENHIRLIDGRMPAEEQPVNGVYETLIVQKAIFDLKLTVGEEYVYTDDVTGETIVVKPVGVFDKNDDADIFWNNNAISRYSRTFMLPFDVFERDFTSGTVGYVRSMYYNIVLDYHKMKLANVEDYLSTISSLKQQLNRLSYHQSVNPIAMDTIELYTEREEKLRTLLWSMNVPVMIMLAFYLYMVSNLIMERQKTEIAVLRSRGASRLQIMVSFLIEGIVLSAIALAIGPLVGLWLTKVLGASNGFLEFVQRSSLEVRIDKSTYVYGLYAIAFGIVTMLVPGFVATRTSIVGHKQQMARKQKSSVWHRLFLDVILIGISLYGLRGFNQRIKDLAASGLDSSQFTIDPLLFLVPTLFTVGAGLFALRLYPLFVRFVYWIGRRWWPPSLYSTLIQVGRSSSQYQFLMVFLIMTIATGLFSASAARTMNQNNEDKIMYQYGADIVMSVQWANDAPPPAQPGAPQPAPTFITKRTQYIEPAFEPMVRDLPGVVHAAKVFTKEKAMYSGENFNGETTLMAVETDEFGRTTWFKHSLLGGHHLNDYLNLIAPDPTAVLISRSMADQHGLKPGDQLHVGWEMVESRIFTVYGIIDYFPTFQPNPEKPGDPAPKLIVAHLSTVQTLLASEPYDIWLKTEPDVDREALVNELKERKIPLLRYTDVRNELARAKNDPFQLAINGVMTLGFIISIVVSFCGFLLYWTLSLQGRILQIGILRAMGISFRQLLTMLIAEQLLTSGAGILIGLFDGKLSSWLFVKFFQLTFNPATQVPPFEVVFDPRDQAGMFIVVSVMLIVGLSILGYLLSRIKIHQAVKLGED